MACGLRAHERRATPPMTSHSMDERKMASTRSLPSHTIPNPPLMALPIPTPPPLCRATRLMPRAQLPAKHWTAISAITLLPSLMFDVSRKGESVPLTSWWSRPNIMGPTSPLRTISLKRKAIFMRPSAS